MHSAEHLLNQVMVSKFDCGRCFSAHVNKKKSKCDYRFPRELTETEVKEVEKAVNAAISANLEVVAEMVPFAEAETRYNLARLPEAVDQIRIVHIGGFDSCPCIGEHVSNTKEIGEFFMVSQDCSDGVLRIRYRLGEPQ